MGMNKLSKPIVVVVDHLQAGGEAVLSGESASALALATSLTEAAVVAVSATPNPDTRGLGRAGIAKVYAAETEVSRLPAALAELTGLALEDLGEETAAVFFSGTHISHEAAASLGVRLGSAVTVDVTELEVEADQLVASKTVLGGQWQTRYIAGGRCPVVSLAAGQSMEVKASSPQQTEIVPIEVSGGVIEILSSTREEGDGSNDLSAANAVVVGGRGVDGDFDLVRDLAAELGAAVGATRVACDEGWVDRSLQIGQTGVAVSPQVYVGLGVSGAIHHTCGIQGSKVIVAVCDDPDAPIFELADFGIVGDVSEVVPQAVEEMVRLREG